MHHWNTIHITGRQTNSLSWSNQVLKLNESIFCHAVENVIDAWLWYLERVKYHFCIDNVNNANVWTGLRTSGSEWETRRPQVGNQTLGGKTTKLLQTLIRGSALGFSSAPIEVLDICSGKSGPGGQPRTRELQVKHCLAGVANQNNQANTFQGPDGQSKQQQRTWCGRDPGARTFSE